MTHQGDLADIEEAAIGWAKQRYPFPARRRQRASVDPHEAAIQRAFALISEEVAALAPKRPFGKEDLPQIWEHDELERCLERVYDAVLGYTSYRQQPKRGRPNTNAGGLALMARLLPLNNGSIRASAKRLAGIIATWFAQQEQIFRADGRHNQADIDAWARSVWEGWNTDTSDVKGREKKLAERFRTDYVKKDPRKGVNKPQM